MVKEKDLAVEVHYKVLKERIEEFSARADSLNEWAIMCQQQSNALLGEIGKMKEDLKHCADRIEFEEEVEE